MPGRGGPSKGTKWGSGIVVSVLRGRSTSSELPLSTGPALEKLLRFGDEETRTHTAGLALQFSVYPQAS